MTTNYHDAEIDRFDELTVKGFTLDDGTGATRHFERDPDLDHETARR